MIVACMVGVSTFCLVMFADNVQLNRPLPSFLQRGHPNLIVCSQGKQFVLFSTSTAITVQLHLACKFCFVLLLRFLEPWLTLTNIIKKEKQALLMKYRDN